MKEPEIIEIPSKRLIGFSLEMSLSDNQTYALWSQFMPRRKEIVGVVNANLYSVQVYDSTFLKGLFTPQTIFEKWAAVEVAVSCPVPEGMEALTISTGRYAIFIHQGSASNFPQTAQYIYGTWLPQSGYQLADQPHFEVMGEKYLGADHPDSEEEVWVPLI